MGGGHLRELVGHGSLTVSKFVIGSEAKCIKQKGIAKTNKMAASKLK